MARTVNKRPQKSPVVTVIGEGLTEQFYFKHIRSLFNFRYVIKPYYFGVTSLYEMDRKIAGVLDGGGIAVCVFDADVAHRDEAERKKLCSLFRKYGNKESVVFCHSLPSIEYWFLLHFRNTNRGFRDSQDVEGELGKYMEAYEKSSKFLEDERWVEDLCKGNKLGTALDRARNFGDSGQSYTNIYKAFEVFGYRDGSQLSR